MVSRRKAIKILCTLPVGAMISGGLAGVGMIGSDSPLGESCKLDIKGFTDRSKTEPIINASEHAWVIDDPRFPIDPEISTCPSGNPDRNYSGEHLIAEMDVHGIDKTVISHVCYYGRNNDYTVYCVKTWPDRFAGFGLLVGDRLFAPDDSQNPLRLERLIKDDGLCGLRLSPIYDRDKVWLNDPVSYPLWEKAQELNASFNIFLAPEQIGQVADMAQRFSGVDVVIDHLAMIDITRPDSEGIDPLCNLAQYPNVYIRTSMHNPSQQPPPYRDVWPYLERIYKTFGAKRMLFANFYEYLIMKEIIPFFTEEDKVWILGKTAEIIYFKKRI